MLFGLFYSVNAKGNWTNLAEKNLQPGAKVSTIFRLSYYHKNILKTSVLL